MAVTNYLIERCTGAGCTSFAQVGTSATTSFNNTGLTASTSYSYRVRATDAAGNLSGLLEHGHGEHTGGNGHAGADGAGRAWGRRRPQRPRST